MVKNSDLIEWLECFDKDIDVDVWYDQMNDETYLVIYATDDIDNPNRMKI